MVDLRPRKRRTHAEVLQKKCDDFNARWPIGTLVRYYPVSREPEFREGRTVSTAQVLSGHTPVLWLDSEKGCVALENCKPQKAAAQ